MLRDRAWLITVTLLLGCPATPQLSAQCPSLIWSDEFSGSAVDTSRWDIQLGDGCNIGLCGWGNNELQSYQAANATVSGGMLRITARREQVLNRQYTSARLRTINRGDWTFGRFEARIRLPRGQGAWPAFWMLSTDEVYGIWPQSGEIDIMESRGLSTDVSYGTLHFGQLVPNNRAVGRQFNFPESLSEDFHVYAVEWEADEIRWFVDGVRFATKTPADLRGNNWPFDQRFHLLLNLAVGGIFPGPPDPAVFPLTMDVDYVRVYDLSPPHIAGEFSLPIFASGVGYRVENAQAPANFVWEVPEGARIVSGQGTSAIEVDWGQSGGSVRVAFDSACGRQQLQLRVFIRSPDIPEATLENFDDVRGLELIFAAGNYAPDVENPAPSPANPSARVARYRRNAGQKFDALLFATGDFADVSSYVSGTRRLYLDLYTDAPVGTEVTLQFEADARTSPTNFPLGRHSSYTAATTQRNQWETLEFVFNARLDGNTPDTEIDNLVFLFDSGWNSGDTYYFDNLASALVDASPPSAPGGLRLVSAEATALQISWNAAADNLGIADYLVLLDGAAAGSTPETQFNISDLNPATDYQIAVQSRDLAGNLSPLSTPLQVSTAAANLIADPGFESGTAEAWVGASVTGAQSNSGQFAVEFEREASLLIEGLRPGTEYRLTAWLAAAPGASIRLGADRFGGLAASASVTSPEFQQVTVSFVTATGMTSARIFLQAQTVRRRAGWNRRAGARGFADDLELVEVR